MVQIKIVPSLYCPDDVIIVSQKVYAALKSTDQDSKNWPGIVLAKVEEVIIKAGCKL